MPPPSPKKKPHLSASLARRLSLFQTFHSFLFPFLLFFLCRITSPSLPLRGGFGQLQSLPVLWKRLSGSYARPFTPIRPLVLRRPSLCEAATRKSRSIGPSPIPNVVTIPPQRYFECLSIRWRPIPGPTLPTMAPFHSITGTQARRNRTSSRRRNSSHRRPTPLPSHLPRRPPRRRTMTSWTGRCSGIS